MIIGLLGVHCTPWFNIIYVCLFLLLYLLGTALDYKVHLLRGHGTLIDVNCRQNSSVDFWLVLMTAWLSCHSKVEQYYKVWYLWRLPYFSCNYVAPKWKKRTVNVCQRFNLRHVSFVHFPPLNHAISNLSANRYPKSLTHTWQQSSYLTCQIALQIWPMWQPFSLPYPFKKEDLLDWHFEYVFFFFLVAGI